MSRVDTFSIQAVISTKKAGKGEEVSETVWPVRTEVERHIKDGAKLKSHIVIPE